MVATHRSARLKEPTTTTSSGRDLVRSIAAAQLTEIAGEVGETAYAAGQFELARRVFEQVALADDFADFGLPIWHKFHIAE